MIQRVRNWRRKRRHLKYLELFIVSLRWEIVNMAISASCSQWNEDVTGALHNSAVLIRKYERRIMLLRF